MAKATQPTVKKNRKGVEKVGYGVFQMSQGSMTSEIVGLLEMGLSNPDIVQVLTEQGKKPAKSTVGSIRSMWKHDKPLMEAKAVELNKALEAAASKVQPEIGKEKAAKKKAAMEAAAAPKVVETPVAVEVASVPLEAVVAVEPVQTEKPVASVQKAIDAFAKEVIAEAKAAEAPVAAAAVEVAPVVVAVAEEVAPSNGEKDAKIIQIFALYDSKILNQMETFDLLQRV